MKRTLIALSVALLGAAGSATSAATTLDFDDLSGNPAEPLAAGYGGFVWETLGSIAADTHPGSGYANGVTSGSNAAYNWDGAPVRIRWAGPGAFTFEGAFFTSAWQEQELVFEGWRDGVLVHTSPESLGITPEAPQWLAFGWAGIDELRIINSASHWAMDDFRFAAEVPEPAGLAMLGLGLLALAGRRGAQALRPGWLRRPL